MNKPDHFTLILLALTMAGGIAFVQGACTKPAWAQEPQTAGQTADLDRLEELLGQYDQGVYANQSEGSQCRSKTAELEAALEALKQEHEALKATHAQCLKH